jgi:hypothetical protein
MEFGFYLLGKVAMPNSNVRNGMQAIMVSGFPLFREIGRPNNSAETFTGMRDAFYHGSSLVGMLERLNNNVNLLRCGCPVSYDFDMEQGAHDS